MNHNAKDKTHWIDPRSSIATSLKHYDIAYATHGALQAMQILRELNVCPADLAQRTILDYGCGTGRITRVLTGMFHHAYGYDPVPQTIHHGGNEAHPLRFNNLTLTTSIGEIRPVDYGCSVNVIEHLSNDDAQVMIDHLRRLVRGPTVLWYAPQHNADVLRPYLTDAQQEADEDFLQQRSGTIVVRVVDFNGRR